MIFGAIQFSARLNPPANQPSFHAQPTANGSPALAAGERTIVAGTPTLRPPASTPTMTPRTVVPAQMVPSSPTPNEEDESKTLILHLIKAIETHDDPMFLKYVDRDIDYFGHKHASKAFIQRDMEQDAKTYQSVQMIPDLSTLEASADQAFVEYDLDALEVSGKDHKARCRLEIDFAPGPTPRLLSISSRVLSR